MVLLHLNWIASCSQVQLSENMCFLKPSSSEKKKQWIMFANGQKIEKLKAINGFQGKIIFFFFNKNYGVDSMNAKRANSFFRLLSRNCFKVANMGYCCLHSYDLAPSSRLIEQSHAWCATCFPPKNVGKNLHWGVCDEGGSGSSIGRGEQN